MERLETSDEILEYLEKEASKTERVIKLELSMRYLFTLVDPKYKNNFVKAEKAAGNINDMNFILDVAKKHIGQKTAMSMLEI